MQIVEHGLDTDLRIDLHGHSGTSVRFGPIIVGSGTAEVRLNLAPREQWVPWEWLAPYARIINSSNTGAAFGIFKDGALFFTVVAVLVSIAIIVYFPRVPRSQKALRVALALQLGGALGNLADRLIQGGQVTDYISVGRFPVFNVADAAIFVGVVILLVSSFLEGRQSLKQAETESAGEIEHSTG